MAHSTPRCDARLTCQDFPALPVMADYERYCKRVNQTYHVQLQLDSIVLKGKQLPDVSAAVEANFMGEVETLQRRLLIT